LNVKADDDGVWVGVIVGSSLLSTIAGRLCVGIVYNLRIGSEQANLGDVGTVLGRGQRVNVRLESGLRGCIVMLAEEVCFADCFFSKRAFEGTAREN